MKINFDGANYTAETELGTFYGYVSDDGGISVNTPRDEAGKDKYIYINGVGYRFSEHFRVDGGYGGLSLIYREGRWSSGDGVTDKGRSTIYKINREIFDTVKAHEEYSVAMETSRKENINRKIGYLERDIQDLEKKLKELRAQL